MRSRSGNTLQELYTFYDKKGEEVTETRYGSLPKVIRGPIDTTVVVGADWGAWSNFYQFSGEAFKSETPRRFIQLELILSTEDPAVAPVLHALALDFGGRVSRTGGRADCAARCRAQLRRRGLHTRCGPVRPRATRALTGCAFPRRVLWMQRTCGCESVVRNARRVGCGWWGIRCFLSICQRRCGRIRSAVEFTTKVLHNATVFAADLGQEARPGLWQSVEAAERQANLVFLPDLPGSERLIGDLQVVPPVFSPNGDGINDHVQIRFALFKAVDASPSVRIFDLAGRGSGRADVVGRGCFAVV